MSSDRVLVSEQLEGIFLARLEKGLQQSRSLVQIDAGSQQLIQVTMPRGHGTLDRSVIKRYEDILI